MHRRLAFILAAAVLCALSLRPADDIEKSRLAPFKPLPAAMESKSNPITAAKVQLGRVLFFDPRLSRSQDVSCNTCHRLDRYGVDEEQFSTGFKGQKGNRNSPTVYNAAGHVAQFWDGRADDIEAQAKGPVTNPVEMAMPDAAAVEKVLRSMPDYVAMFRAAFPGEKDPVTFDNMARAIGTFERKLVTPSRWDRYLQGDTAALSAAEKAGFRAFTGAGCQTCHSGPYVGGGMFQKLGLAKPFPDTSDHGRFGVTKKAYDEMVFKVPSLRNVEHTGPYFHNGTVRTLDQAVRDMGEYQLSKKLSDADVKSIVAWLKSLTGEIPAEFSRPPVLPRSTAATPSRL